MTKTNKKPPHVTLPLPRGRELDHIEGWGGPCCDCGSCQRDYRWLVKTVRKLQGKNKELMEVLRKKGKLIVFA